MNSDGIAGRNDKARRAVLALERRLMASGTFLLGGIDEAGRGPLAGPVVAAAVILPPGLSLKGVDDSKRLSASRREELFEIITACALSYGIGIVENERIDEINILNATFLAMDYAVAALPRRPNHLLIDGNLFRPGESTSGIPYTTVIGGDGLSETIAAASILAKVTRDRIMAELDRRFPGYGFAQHKGYGTAAHREAIARLGLCPAHRRSFTLRTEVPAGEVL